METDESIRLLFEEILEALWESEDALLTETGTHNWSEKYDALEDRLQEYRERLEILLEGFGDQHNRGTSRIR